MGQIRPRPTTRLQHLDALDDEAHTRASRWRIASALSGTGSRSWTKCWAAPTYSTWLIVFESMLDESPSPTQHVHACLANCRGFYDTAVWIAKSQGILRALYDAGAALNAVFGAC